MKHIYLDRSSLKGVITIFWKHHVLDIDFWNGENSSTFLRKQLVFLQKLKRFTRPYFQNFNRVLSLIWEDQMNSICCLYLLWSWFLSLFLLFMHFTILFILHSSLTYLFPLSFSNYHFNAIFLYLFLCSV